MKLRNNRKYGAKKPLRHSLLGLLALVVLVGIVGRMTFVMAGRLYQVDKKRNAAIVELSEITDLTVALETKVERLNSEEGLEIELRERYGVGAPGEGLILLLDEEGDGLEVEEEPKKRWWWFD